MADDKKDQPNQPNADEPQAQKKDSPTDGSEGKEEAKAKETPKVTEPKVETPAEEKKEVEATAKDAEAKAEVKMTADQKKLIDQIEKMTVLELHKLVKVMEEKFGVSAQAVAVAAPEGGGGDDAVEEQDSFTVHLTDVGAQKIQVIKALKEMLGLGLKEAKDLTDDAPSLLKEGVKKAEAEEMKAKIEAAGGKAELK